MVNEVKVLRAARELIARPGGWTKGASARTAAGNPTYATNDAAVCWCAYGAYLHVGGSTHENLRAALQIMLDVEDWNDNPERTQNEVVTTFDVAIVRLESAAS